MEWSAHEIAARIPFRQVLAEGIRAAAVPAWLVGGAVRDLLLDRPVADYDIATPDPDRLVPALADTLHGSIIPLDVEFGITRIARRDGTCIDVCRFRDTDIDGDLRGRDFTLNAIALRLPDGEQPAAWHDPLHGYEDLQAGILRVIAPTAFRDDPLRALRAFRFVAELGFILLPETREALRPVVRKLPRVAAERLLAEWWKLCAGPHADDAIDQMDEAGVLDVLFPEFAAARGVTQNVFHRYDVHGHLLATARFAVAYLREPESVFGDLMEDFAPVFSVPHRRARLVTLALLHDIGKPPTRSVGADKRIHFYSHEDAGEHLLLGIAERLRMSRDDTRAMAAIVHYHMRPLFLMHELQKHPLSPKTMLKFFDATGPVALDVMALALADKSAGQGTLAEPDIVEKLRVLYHILLTFYKTQYLPALEQPLLTGGQLINDLGLPPGPQIGRLLRQIRAQQISGALTNSEDALRWAQGVINADIA